MVLCASHELAECMGHAQPLGELVASSWGRVMIYLAVKQAKEPNVNTVRIIFNIILIRIIRNTGGNSAYCSTLSGLSRGAYP